jgi:hypothetical protein
METQTSHCQEELDLPALLKEVLNLLNAALVSLAGKKPPSFEVEYLGLASNFVIYIAMDYVLLRESGRVNGSKLLMHRSALLEMACCKLTKDGVVYHQKREKMRKKAVRTN